MCIQYKEYLILNDYYHYYKSHLEYTHQNKALNTID